MRPLLLRWSHWIAIAGFVAFLLLDQLAITLAVPAHNWHTDVIFALAGRGSSVWQIEDAALLAFAVAHLSAAGALRRQWQAPVLARLVLASGVAFLGAALFRLGCPQGEAGCGIKGGENQLDDGLSALHAGMVTIYLLLMLLTMVVAGFSSYRRKGAARGVLLVSFPLVGLAYYCLGRFGAGPDFGLWERCWLVCNATWVTLLMLTRRAGAGVSR